MLKVTKSCEEKLLEKNSDNVEYTLFVIVTFMSTGGNVHCLHTGFGVPHHIVESVL